MTDMNCRWLAFLKILAISLVIGDIACITDFRGLSFGKFQPVNRQCVWPLQRSFAHPTSCNLYYSCLIGRPMIHQCPQGTSYNTRTARCEDSWRVDCQGRLPPKSRSNRICINPTGIYTDVSSCNTYINCAGGIPYQRVCPQGLLFDSRLKVCNNFQKVNCEGRNVRTLTTITPKTREGGSFTCPSKQGVFSNNRDCRQFWLCRDFKHIKLLCPQGLLFDKIAMECIINGRC